MSLIKHNAKQAQTLIKKQTSNTHIPVTEEVSYSSKWHECFSDWSSYLSIDQCSEWQVVKQVCEVLPDIGIAVLPQALVVEAIDLCDLPWLMVPSQDGDSLLETNLRDRANKKLKDQNNQLIKWSIILITNSWTTKCIYKLERLIKNENS